MISPRLATILFWFLIVVIYVGFSMPLIPIGTDEIRMVAVYSVDESDILTVVNQLYTSGVFQRPSFTYGGGMYYAVLLLLWIWDVFGVVDGQVVALALRIFCLMAGLGCLAMLVKLGKQVFSVLVGRVAALLLVTLPVFLRWTVEGHPDLPQLFWTLCTLWMCCRLCRVFSVRDVGLAAMFAGLSFGTKYGGGFLLPVIGLSIFLTSEDGMVRWGQIKTCLQTPKRWIALALIPIVFLLTFAVINPYAVIDYDIFLQKMQSYRSVMSAGHTYIGESAGYLWLRLLGGDLGVLHVACFAVGLMAFRRGILADCLILMLWCFVLVGYLMSEVQMRHMRHLLPVLPSVLLFAAEGYRYLSHWAERRIKQSALIFLVVFLGTGIWGRAERVVDLFQHKWTAESGREELVAGKWLAAQFSEETTILYDVYAYIPGKFQHALPATPAMNYLVVTHFEPDLLILRDARHARYSDLADSNQVSLPKRYFFDIHYFYPYVHQQRLPDYRLLRKFGRTSIYQRVQPRHHYFSFSECSQILQDGHMINEVSARERMGDAALQAGDWQEALREYRIAVDLAPDQQPTLRYKLGRAYAAVGDLDSSQQIFKNVLQQDFLSAERANIVWDMAQFYFAGALYDTALDYIQQAIGLNENITAAHFDLAALHLVRGEIAIASQLYDQAVRRFGADTSAVVKLKTLKKRGIQPEAVDRILTQYF